MGRSEGEIPSFLHNLVTILGRSQEIRLEIWVAFNHTTTALVFLVTFFFFLILQNPLENQYPTEALQVNIEERISSNVSKNVYETAVQVGHPKYLVQWYSIRYLY